MEQVDLKEEEEDGAACFCAVPGDSRQHLIIFAINGL